MTLEQAYKMRREENIALLRENERLKKQLDGVFPATEKETLERKIRHLEQLVMTSEKRYDSMREHCRITESRCYDLDLEILDLKEQVSALSSENESLRIRAEKAEAEVLMLNGTKKLLEKKLNTNFENSSLPSSALPFRKKITNSRKPSGRKPGAQPGHQGHYAERLLTTKEPVFIPAPESFTDDPDLYPTGKQITKQLIDINVSVSVTDFITDEYRNRITGSRMHVPFPAGLVNDVNYGPSVKAFAFLLNNYYNVSINKTRQCIYDITNGTVNISNGTIANLSEAFSVATEKDRAKIFSLLTHSDVLYSDATVSNINGKRKAVILCTDKKNVLYQHLEHKGHDGLTKTPVKDFDGILIHDHDKSYYSYGSKHQECLAHVLRYLVGAMENEPDLKWHKQMHSLLQKMIHTAKKYKDGVPPERVDTFTAEYKSILAVAADEYTLHPPPKEYMDGYNLHLKLSKYQKEHLLFLTHPEIDCTNNISERELRKFKRKQKQAVVLRSDHGGQRICDALTIIETARMQNQNVYDAVESVFKK